MEPTFALPVEEEDDVGELVDVELGGMALVADLDTAA
jgi:hypothetical protein